VIPLNGYRCRRDKFSRRLSANTAASLKPGPEKHLYKRFYYESYCDGGNPKAEREIPLAHCLIVIGIFGGNISVLQLPAHQQDSQYYKSNQVAQPYQGNQWDKTEPKKNEQRNCHCSKIARVATSSVNAALNIRRCDSRFTVYWRATKSAIFGGLVYYPAARRAGEGTDISHHCVVLLK